MIDPIAIRGLLERAARDAERAQSAVRRAESAAELRPTPANIARLRNAEAAAVRAWNRHGKYYDIAIRTA